MTKTNWKKGPIDPDRYQMKDIKRRLTRLEDRLNRTIEKLTNLALKLSEFSAEPFSKPPEAASAPTGPQDNEWLIDESGNKI